MVEVGSTDAPDHNPQSFGGVGAERFVYSDRQGLWHSPLEIGARVYKGVVIGNIEGLPIAAPIDGFIRGLVRDGLRTPHGVSLNASFSKSIRAAAPPSGLESMSIAERSRKP